MNEPEDQVRYIELREEFDSNLVSHFPTKLLFNTIDFSFSKVGFSYYGGLSITNKYFSKNQYNMILEQYKPDSQFAFYSTDSCLFTIRTDESNFGFIGASKRCEKTIPIPQYLFYENDDMYNIVSNDAEYEILILDSDTGDYLDEDNLLNQDNYPSPWEQGFCRGLAFNDKKIEIIYWLIIW